VVCGEINKNGISRQKAKSKVPKYLFSFFLALRNTTKPQDFKWPLASCCKYFAEQANALKRSQHVYFA